ncbi:hypothetical protein SAMN05660359_04479 [Geodermatophilus obscurus]|uniref:Uncharacterized protein n=1 Tax=Geodermatophilus obscurus TaxID=1861 RepID=A0A1I5ICJ0_9ACTN|nr:hypothetical protein [Geodermatophilus obscurus]SFO58039.1 hypothetical protein SAMN05660359_04479 [Geodermatophilus obscurus]
MPLVRLTDQARYETYRVTATAPYDDRERAVAGSRGQLRLMAIADSATPDWSTMTIEGPVEVTGLHGATWYEWTATGEARRNGS